MKIVAEKNKKFTAQRGHDGPDQDPGHGVPVPGLETVGRQMPGLRHLRERLPHLLLLRRRRDRGRQTCKRRRKTKTLYSCNVVDFAEVAGGHNFRPERHTRLKYRYYHKHRGFVEAYEESLCVGCGRCGEACLAGITVPEVIASVRGEES